MVSRGYWVGKWSLGIEEGIWNLLILYMSRLEKNQNQLA